MGLLAFGTVTLPPLLQRLVLLLLSLQCLSPLVLSRLHFLRTTTYPSSYRTMSSPSGSSSSFPPLPPEEEDCFRSPRPHHHAEAINLITAYAVELYNSAHLESDFPIPPLSTFSILKCAELMVAKSVMAIPEALAPTLCFSTTA